MKDNFSSQSEKYAKYRPAYPSAFFNYLNSLIENRQNAWDCGTGNGQVAFELSKTFGKVLLLISALSSSTMRLRPATSPIPFKRRNIRIFPINILT